MSSRKATPELMATALKDALDRARIQDEVGRPVLRKKLRTLMRASGRAVLAPSVRANLAKALAGAGLHVAPDVADRAVPQDTWLTISLHPIEPEAFLFAKEKHLERFIEASLGRGVLKNLKLYQHAGRSGRQFTVGGKVVDLLCKEALSTHQWGLVAIEVKRAEAPRGTLTQMCEYLALLSQGFPGRPIRGIIVSSSEDAIDRKVLGEAATGGYRIDWLRYSVSFERVGASAAKLSA